VATVVVMACYVAAVITLNLLVVDRLTGQADTRLAERLTDAQRTAFEVPAPVPTPAPSDRDPDDAPRFVWSVTGLGTPTALTAGAPALPPRTWTVGASTLELSGTPFRFRAVRSGKGWLVAGESLAQVDRVRSALVAPELLFGLALLASVFVGSLIIGLRASAPLELVHRRQVEFTADASHELRTPLSVIQAEVELALSRPRSPDQYRAVLERIAGESGRLRTIVDDLLWLARIDDERIDAPPHQTTDVAITTAASAERFQSLARARDVTLRVDVDRGEAPVLIDPDWVDRLVGVLVDNACKYAGAGGHVEVGVSCTANRVVLRVDDSGPGIPPDQRPLVFDRFHRASDRTHGSGLGLAIADSVVRASEGTWLVTDAPSGGARMEVSWRRANAERQPAEDATGPDTRPTAPPARRPGGGEGRSVPDLPVADSLAGDT
jgi:signal transduction histidine kinase